MKKIIALMFLTSCTGVLVDGEQYKCEAVFHCDGGSWDVTPSVVCGFDHEDAVDRYEEYLENLTADALCSRRGYAPICVPRNAPCEPSER